MCVVRNRRLLPLAGQHVLPIITNIDGIDIIPNDRCRNATIQHHPITPLTRRKRRQMSAQARCRKASTEAACRGVSVLVAYPTQPHVEAEVVELVDPPPDS